MSQLDRCQALCCTLLMFQWCGALPTRNQEKILYFLNSQGFIVPCLFDKRQSCIYCHLNLSLVFSMFPFLDACLGFFYPEHSNQIVLTLFFPCVFRRKFPLHPIHLGRYYLIGLIFLSALFQEIITGASHSSAIDWWSLGKTIQSTKFFLYIFLFFGYVAIFILFDMNLIFSYVVVPISSTPSPSQAFPKRICFPKSTNSRTNSKRRAF